MPSAATIRSQIECELARKIPSALTPVPKIVRPVIATGIDALDALLEGGLPVGAITEIIGPECSGRCSLAFSFLAGLTQAGSVCAWIDVSDMLQPESATAAGIDLRHMLWVRCGMTARISQPISSAKGFALPDRYLVPPSVKKGLHGGSHGIHPQQEIKGLSAAVSGLLRPEAIAPRCAEPQRTPRKLREAFEPNRSAASVPTIAPIVPCKPWTRLDQALRVADLVLQGGGFSAIVLDLGSITPKDVLRVPLATWFRYRAAAERSHANILLLTQHHCSKTSAGVVLRLHDCGAGSEGTTILAGIEHRVEVERNRFSPTPSNVIPLRKPPQRERAVVWNCPTTWVGQR